MTLANLGIKETRVIKKVSGEDVINARLLSLGFFAGNSICVLYNAFGTTLLKVGSSRIAITTSLLENIEVEDE